MSNKEESRLSRRHFVGSATAATLAAGVTASSYGRVIGSNERISLGLIGCGSRGNAHLRDCLRFGDVANSEMAAVCDIWRARCEKARDTVYEETNKKPRVIYNYEDVISRKDIDAVVIASADHQHPYMLKEAAELKKDVYVEKPLSLKFKPLLNAVKAVKANKVIVQNGTQLRSMSSFTGCRELFQSGQLGDAVKFEQGRNEYRGYWYSRLAEVREEDTDWKAFQMHEKKRPWNPRVYSGWYGHLPYSNGALGGLMSHFIDLVHYITGATAPKAVVAIGGKYLLNDDFTVPDTVQAVFEYPGFSVSYHTDMGNGGANYFRGVGTKGLLDMVNWGSPIVTGEGCRNPDALPTERVPVTPVERDHHMLDWLKCIRSRKEPNAGIEAGYSQSLAAIMADMALIKKRRMVYNPEKKKISAG